MKSKKYPNLYWKSDQKNWVFSKFSAARGGEFRMTTSYEATDALAGAAYKEGMEKFNTWMGSAALKAGRNPLIRDIAKITRGSKKAKSSATQIKMATELDNHILPSFGHLRPDQITSIRLQKYENEERAKGRTSLFNTRKILFEILRLAKSEGLIKELPKWRPADPDPAPPKFIDSKTFKKIRREIKGPEKLILTICYYQGARPNEVCQYRWEMINWETGEISIPKAISKTRRARVIPINRVVLRILRFMRQETGPIFPMKRKGREGQSRVVYDAGWYQAMEKLGLDYVFYNLRDTFISRKLQEGINAIYVAKYVDSSVKEIERRYVVVTSEVLKRLAL
jgi:integrase